MYHSDQLQHVESDDIQNYQIGTNTFSDDANKSNNSTCFRIAFFHYILCCEDHTTPNEALNPAPKQIWELTWSKLRFFFLGRQQSAMVTIWGTTKGIWTSESQLWIIAVVECKVSLMLFNRWLYCCFMNKAIRNANKMIYWNYIFRNQSAISYFQIIIPRIIYMSEHLLFPVQSLQIRRTSFVWVQCSNVLSK